MADAPLIFYAKEDERTLDVLGKHLLTLDIVPDRVVLSVDRVGPHLRQIKDERPFIILVSVDSLVILKECMGILERMMHQRKQRFSKTGVISVLCRPCAWRETTLASTCILSYPGYVPITTRGKIDQACLGIARDLKEYLYHWDQMLQCEGDDRQEELDLRALYGPPGDAEHFIGDTIRFTLRDSMSTGQVIYIQANGKYIVQVKGEMKHSIVDPCDVVEGK